MQLHRNAERTKRKTPDRDALKSLRNKSGKILTYWYHNKGLTGEELGRRWGVSRQAVENAMSRRGVKLRTLAEAGRTRYRKIGFRLTTQQEQLIYGSLLGDACLHRVQSRTKAGNHMSRLILQFAHGQDQLAYLQHKHSVLPCSKVYQRPEGSNLGKPIHQTTFSNTVVLEPVAALCHKANKKFVTKAWLDRLNYEGLAYWYMDDGCLVQNKDYEDTWRLQFSTNSFSRPEVELLVDKLKSMGFHTCIGDLNRPNKPATEHIILMNNRKHIRKFLTKISKYVQPCLHYKLRALASYATAVKPG